jgi:DNA-directed RNA polymerase subunit RPC12/RpoP
MTLAQAKANGDRDTYRQIYKQIYSQWLQECPMAVSPRAMNDLTFRQQLIAYFAECAVTKDLDPRQAPLEAKMQMLAASLQRIPSPSGTWMVKGDTFWAYADVFKQQMEMAYDLMHKMGVDQMDPDNAQSGVALRMEYSTFCQAWLPHLSPEDGERLLKFYGVSAEYDEVKPQQTDKHSCGACGSEINHLPGAKQVVCESCGFTIDVGGAAIPCSKCGSLLSFPVSKDRIHCPYCRTETRKV